MKAGISVIIPTNNRSHFLSQCLESLLRQTYVPDEILIIDNANQPSTRKIASHYKKSTKTVIKYIVELKKGPSNARNRGIKEAKYEYLLFIDDDCIADKRWVKVAMDIFNKTKKIVFFGRNINGNPDNFFASLEQLSTEAYFKSYLYKSSPLWKSYLLDTKNFAIKKPFLTSHKIRFNHKISTLEDLDLGMSIRAVPEDIFYQPQMIVTHYGRNTLIDHLLREFNKGKGFFLNNKRNQHDNFYSKIVKNAIMRKEEKSRRQQLKTILRNKELMYKLLFYSFIHFDLFIMNCGFKYQFLRYKLSKVIL